MGQMNSGGASYFGKVPARGDFIKGGESPQMIVMLDEWVSGCMDLLSRDARWRIDYDNMSAVDFAFVGPGSRVAIVGHLQPSRDASSRRFPFLVAATVEGEDRLLFDRAPAAFWSLWRRFEHAVAQARSSDDPVASLRPLSSIDCGEEIEQSLAAAPLPQFTEATTIGAVDQLLAESGLRGSLRRSILALGMLLRPLLSARKHLIEKGLQLPLPTEPSARHCVAAVWVSLIARFVRRTDCELQILQGQTGGRQVLIVGFNGASARTLLSLVSPHNAPDAIVRLDDPEWIDDHPELVNDYGVAKLSSYLSQPDTTLEVALATFREVFLGE